MIVLKFSVFLQGIIIIIVIQIINYEYHHSYYRVNTIPTTHIWRNYNYPTGSTSRYSGSYRVNTMTAVRATTAAPTFFVPVQHEDGLFCDGALVANNPTAIALQEAKQLFPGVPIETVVSIGNHYHHYYQYHHYYHFIIIIVIIIIISFLLL